MEYSRKYARLWQTGRPETPVEQALLENRIGRFAICEQKADCFEYWIAGLYRGGAVPEGLKLYRFPESDWAVFSARGPLPGSLQALTRRTSRPQPAWTFRPSSCRAAPCAPVRI